MAYDLQIIIAMFSMNCDSTHGHNNITNTFIVNKLFLNAAYITPKYKNIAVENKWNIENLTGLSFIDH